MNNDGVVDDLDVNPFVQALTNRAAYDANNYGLDADFVGDFNGNGVLDLGDVSRSTTRSDRTVRWRTRPPRNMRPAVLLPLRSLRSGRSSSTAESLKPKLLPNPDSHNPWYIGLADLQNDMRIVNRANKREAWGSLSPPHSPLLHC